MILPHKTVSAFWARFDELPDEARKQARSAYNEWKNNSRATGLRFKNVAGNYYSARIGSNFRALCKLENGVWEWFWIGTHAEYDRLMRGK